MSEEDICKLVEALQVQDSSILGLLSNKSKNSDNSNDTNSNSQKHDKHDVNALTFEIEKLQSLVISYQDKYIKLKRNADKLKRQLEQKELEALLAQDNNSNSNENISKTDTIIKSPRHQHSNSHGSNHFKNINNDKNVKAGPVHVKLKRRNHPQRNQLSTPKKDDGQNHRKIVSGHSWWAPPVAIDDKNDVSSNSGPADMSTMVVHMDRRGSVLENFIVDKVQDDEIVQQVQEEERRLNRAKDKLEEINRYDKDLENYKRFLGLLRSHKSERELTLKQIRNTSL